MEGATKMDDLKRENLSGAPFNFSPFLTYTPGPPLPSSHGLISSPFGSSPLCCFPPLDCTLLSAPPNSSGLRHCVNVVLDQVRFGLLHYAVTL